MKSFFDSDTYERTKEIEFYGIPKEINVISAMNHARFYSKTINKNNHPKLKSLISRFFHRRNYLYDSCFKSKYPFIIYYGYYNYRQDHHEIMDNFVSCFDSDYIIFRGKTTFESRNVLEAIKGCGLIIIWLFQLLPLTISIYEKLYIVEHVIDAYFFIKEAEQLEFEKYKFLVVYYDASFDDNILVQMFRNRNIPTMTLQHGLFKKFKDNVDEILLSGMEYYCSISDYFLTWNKISESLAIEGGVPSSRIRILGMPRFVSKANDLPKCASPSNGDIGVFMGAPSQLSENISIIKIANEYCTSNGKKYVVRLHPMDRLDNYLPYLGDSYRETSSNQLSLLEYANSISFTLIGSSSALIDLVFMKHKVFHYSGDEYDKYSSLDCCVFTNYDSLIQCISNDNNSRLYEELCTVEDPFTAYRDFFSGMLENVL